MMRGITGLADRRSRAMLLRSGALMVGWCVRLDSGVEADGWARCWRDAARSRPRPHGSGVSACWSSLPRGHVDDLAQGRDRRQPAPAGRRPAVRRVAAVLAVLSPMLEVRSGTLLFTTGGINPPDAPPDANIPHQGSGTGRSIWTMAGIRQFKPSTRPWTRSGVALCPRQNSAYSRRAVRNTVASARAGPRPRRTWALCSITNARCSSGRWSSTVRPGLR